MATEKGNAVDSKNGVVTHKLVIETTEGNFAVSLFSNNDLHVDFAKAFGDGTDFKELFETLVTNVKIVKNEVAPKDDSRTNRLLALKAGAVQP